MLKHVSFITARPEAVVSFYGRLGGTLVKDVTSSDAARRLVIEFPGGGKLQFFVSEGASTPPSWMEHIAIRVPALKATVAAFEADGVSFSRPLHLSPSGNPVAFALDPDGRHVELLQG
ncbi:VOC family protein [Deinococcus yavapaiensis]|uniref:Lactoylglutathione lyase n=1 Tax=Deinococcus yavapaiensis KR-236 TaxID=694435 RepID=A0A318SEI2_9DEIO|nr:VOC family protein [Deinococcus yavapaiensis]PYE55958.1 lactoylglutathione lyase [Deinococcus yavapaiensis KR-236]